jgi:hypothetical protein
MKLNNSSSQKAYLPLPTQPSKSERASSIEMVKCRMLEQHSNLSAPLLVKLESPSSFSNPRSPLGLADMPAVNARRELRIVRDASSSPCNLDAGNAKPDIVIDMPEPEATLATRPSVGKMAQAAAGTVARNVTARSVSSVVGNAAELACGQLPSVAQTAVGACVPIAAGVAGAYLGRRIAQAAELDSRRANIIALGMGAGAGVMAFTAAPIVGPAASGAVVAGAVGNTVNSLALWALSNIMRGAGPSVDLENPRGKEGAFPVVAPTVGAFAAMPFLPSTLFKAGVTTMLQGFVSGAVGAVAFGTGSGIVEFAAKACSATPENRLVFKEHQRMFSEAQRQNMATKTATLVVAGTITSNCAAQVNEVFGPQSSESFVSAVRPAAVKSVVGDAVRAASNIFDDLVKRAEQTHNKTPELSKIV